MTLETSTKLTLISHRLCPYVQRVAIALAEKSLPFTRVDIDLAAKPEWFHAISPLGKTPVLKVGDSAIFESAVILEYLEDVYPPSMHPVDSLARADRRAWIEVSSSILNDIAGFYGAATPDGFAAKSKALKESLVTSSSACRKAHISPGQSFRWSMRPSRPSFAISTSSTRSQTLEFWRASRRRQNGGKLCASAHPSKLRSPPIIPHGCVRSSWRATQGSRSSCKWPLRTAAGRSSEPKGR
jgi:hypothetical protein